MHIRFRQYLEISLLAIGLLFLAACGTLQVDVGRDADQTVQVVATVTAGAVEAEVTLESVPSPSAPAEDRPEPTNTPSPTAEPGPSGLWSIYRDPDAGYGYAFPCHWIQQITTLVSYDEAFFMSRSTRGQWAEGDPPPAAVKLEIARFNYADQGIAPGTSLEEAVPLTISDEIVSTERVILGGREALRVNLSGTVYPGDTTNEIYFFPIADEAMLLLSVIPRGALDSTDVQGVVNSLALTGEERVAIPVADPQGTLEGREVMADKAAGYCFQFPSEYNLEAYPPSGVPYAGDIVTLKLERPFYTVGLTSTALPVGEQSNLEELVSQYLLGLPEGGAQVTRNPAERVGGVVFQIGGEPAEYLEGVPGVEGSRDILVKHAGRLYRLSFVPSTEINPQAEPELETLFLVVTTSFSFLP
jgi:hypothetical protein